MSGSIIVSILALLISGVALMNSMKQRKISSEAHRLNLYQRRFAVYERVVIFMDLMVQGHSVIDTPDFKKAEAGMVRSVKEAHFLFSAESGVPSTIKAFWEMTSLKVRTWRGFNESAPAHLGNAVNVLNPPPVAEMEAMLKKLEEDLESFLNFHQVSL